MKTFKIQFITNSNNVYNGSIAAEVVRRANSAENAIAKIKNELSEGNLKRYNIKAVELI